MKATDSVEAISLAWEKKTGCDSIPTIERVYEQTPSGAYCCVEPGCKIRRRDPRAMWQHVHSSHGREDLPPEDFDPRPWL
jgi:hypothetical protein